MISCQFSLYALGERSQSPSIGRAISALRDAGLEPDVGAMSTYFIGDDEKVFDGLRRAFETASREGPVVMAVTVSNACPV